MNLSRYINLWVICIVVLFIPQTSCTKRLANVFPLGKTYYNETRLYNDLKDIANNKSNYAGLHIIGTTAHDDKPIYALQIQTDLDRIPVLVIGQHHGDEVMGVEIAMGLAKQLTNPVDSIAVEQLLSKYSFWIIPTLNPEAYAIVTSGKNEWKRKNNTDTNRNKKLDILTDGVDLNRNYPTFWSLDQNLPESNFFYKGASPASEQEIQAILQLTETHKFKYAFCYHSSISGALNEKIFLPWQDKRDKSSKQDFIEMRKLALFYASHTPKDYVEGNYTVHPGNTSKLGNSRNHLYYTYGTFAYDIEVCGKSKSGIGIVHPIPAVKDSIVKKNVQAIIKTLQIGT